MNWLASRGADVEAARHFWELVDNTDPESLDATDYSFEANTNAARALLILTAEESRVVIYAYCPVSKRWMCYLIRDGYTESLGRDGVSKWEALCKLVEASE